MDEIYAALDEAKSGFIQDEKTQKFYDNYETTIGKYPTLALLGLMRRKRSRVSMKEIEMIAAIAANYKPVDLHN